MEYCCIVWSPVAQKWIYELEKTQKSFTSKINGMEEMDYHERLKNETSTVLKEEEKGIL